MCRQDCGQETDAPVVLGERCKQTWEQGGGGHCSGQVPQSPELCNSSAVQRRSAWIAGTPPARDRAGSPHGEAAESTKARTVPWLVHFTTQAASRLSSIQPKTGCGNVDPNPTTRQREMSEKFLLPAFAASQRSSAIWKAWATVRVTAWAIFFLGDRKAWHSSAPLSWLCAT